MKKGEKKGVSARKVTTSISVIAETEEGLRRDFIIIAAVVVGCG